MREGVKEGVREGGGEEHEAKHPDLAHPDCI